MRHGLAPSLGWFTAVILLVVGAGRLECARGRAMCSIFECVSFEKTCQ